MGGIYLWTHLDPNAEVMSNIIFYVPLSNVMPLLTDVS